MKLIDTSVITPGKQYPGLANVNGQSVGNTPVHAAGSPSAMQGLDFMQQAVMDMVDALCRALIADPTQPTVISIIPIGFFAGYTAPMYVYHNGEVFFVPSQSDLAVVGSYQIANIESNPTDTSPNPQTTMSDGSQVSIHNQRTITLSWVTSGTGNFPNPSTWKYPQNNFQFFAPTINVVGAAGQPAYATGWSADTRLAFYIIGNEVTIQGDANFTSGASALIFTLPNGYRPANYLYFPVIQTGGTVTLLYISPAGDVMFEGSTSAGSWINFTAKYTIL